MLKKIGTKFNKNNEYMDQIEYKNIDSDMWHATRLTRAHLKKV